MAWKHYPTRVSLKYGLRLVGFPREVVCDPSDLTVNELLTLRKSLQKGTCSFKPLSEADKEALRLMVDEQDRMGENPWGKRKRRDDAGKPKKKRKIPGSIMRLGSSDPLPPSCSSSGYEVQVEMNLDDPDNDVISNGDISQENEIGLPHQMVQTRTRKVADPVVVCGNTSASSSARIAGPAAHLAPFTPSTGVNAMTKAKPTHGQRSYLLRKVGTFFSSDSESGEDEYDDDDPFVRFARSIDPRGGSPEYQESDGA